MLVLTRGVGQWVRINDDIGCAVLSIRPNQIRLGFVAPKEIVIHRDEIYLQIAKEQGKTAMPLPLAIEFPLINSN